MAAHRRIVVASILGIAACGGGDGPSPPIIEVDSASQSVSATRGGIISLPSGSSLTIPPGALAKDRLISISVLPALPLQPPSGAIVGVGPAFRVRFSPTPSSSGSEAVSGYRSDPDDFVVELKITNLSVTGLIGSAPMADIVDQTGGHHFVGISGTLNESSGVATFTVPSAVAENALEVYLTRANFSPSMFTDPDPPLGPRIWDGTRWRDFPQGFSPNKKTLVLTHGILSNVENAFGPCVSEIMNAGGYEQVVGFNYDWTQGISVGGGQLATFLNTLQTAGLNNVDIQAHSYGTVVSMYAASQSNIGISNMVLEGGPLRGTPLNSPYLLGLLAEHPLIVSRFVGRVTLDKVLNGGLIRDVIPNAAVLDIARRDAMARHPNTNFVKVVGQWTLPARRAFELLGAHNPMFDAPGDWIVPVSSARGSDLPGPALFYDLKHTQLECDARVLRDVGLAVKGNQPPPPPPPGQTFTLALGKTGNGSGTISATPSMTTYPAGTPVVVNAVPASTSHFDGFSGDCTGFVCNLVMNSNKSVTAAFIVGRFDGPYEGTYTGTIAGPGHSGPVSGAVKFTVRKGVLTMTEPLTGGANISETGATSFGGKLNGGPNCSFAGTFVNDYTAEGTWTCNDGQISGSGTWSAKDRGRAP